MSAPSIRRTAFTVSNSGSPGPAPTSQTVPRGKSSGCIARLLGQNACERGATRPAVGARADRAADRRDIGEALVADRRDDRFQSEDRKSVVKGESASVRVDRGGRSHFKKNRKI